MNSGQRKTFRYSASSTVVRRLWPVGPEQFWQKWLKEEFEANLKEEPKADPRRVSWSK